MIGYKPVCMANNGGDIFPDDYIMLKFTDVSIITFDPSDVSEWNDWLIAQGSVGVNFTDVKIEFGVVKLAGNLPDVTSLTVFYKALKEVEISKLVNLERVNLANNYIENSEILVGLTNLTHIKLDLNLMNDVNLNSQRDADKLVSLSLSGNSLFGGIDFAGLGKLEFVALNGCDLPELASMGALTALIELQCDTNQLPNLDVTNCSQLERLSCGRNPLHELNLSNNAKLVSLQAAICEFVGSFNIASNPNLKLISLQFNQIGELIGYDQLNDIDVATSFFLNDNLLDIAKIGDLFSFIVTAGTYPGVLKIDGAGNAAIGGDPLVVADYTDIAGHGTIITVNM